jgi:hypothetical protein
MTLYLVLFLVGFLFAVVMLAYASLSVAELDKKMAAFDLEVTKRQTKPLEELNTLVAEFNANANAKSPASPS